MTSKTNIQYYRGMCGYSRATPGRTRWVRRGNGSVNNVFISYHYLTTVPIFSLLKPCVRGASQASLVSISLISPKSYHPLTAVSTLLTVNVWRHHLVEYAVSRHILPKPPIHIYHINPPGTGTMATLSL